MRLWSLHPRYLDPQGLVALWREGLLARHVLHGLTKGYRNHPQLDRFKTHATPQLAIDAYLWAVQQQATERGYRFDSSKLGLGMGVIRRSRAGQRGELGQACFGGFSFAWWWLGQPKSRPEAVVWGATYQPADPAFVASLPCKAARRSP